MDLERFVRGGKQKIAEVLGRGRQIIPSVIPDIPQAEGDERERLIVHADQLVAGEIFNHQSFADFVGTMREIVGFEDRSNGPSNALTYERCAIKCYLEFNGKGNTATIDIIRGKTGYRSDFGRRALFLEQSEDGFSLKMATWPAYPSDIREIQYLLNIDDDIAFTEDAHLPPYNGKGGIVWTRAPLSERIVQSFCRKIVEQAQALPSDYIFVPVEVIDEQSQTLKTSFWDRYFRR